MGRSADQSLLLAHSGSGNAYVVSTLAGPFGVNQMRATKVDPTGKVLAWFDFGAVISGIPTASATDAQGNLLVVGSNGFVMKLDSNLTQVIASAMLSGQAGAVAVDSTGNLYVSDSTRDANFPVTAGAYQTRPPQGTSLGTPRMRLWRSSLQA